MGMALRGLVWVGVCKNVFADFEMTGREGGFGKLT